MSNTPNANAYDESEESNIHGDCEAQDCFLPTSRRRFLRDSFLSVAGALVAVGMSKTAAFAMPLEFTDAKRAKGSMRSYAVPNGDGAQIDKDNDVILVRWQDAIYAFACRARIRIRRSNGTTATMASNARSITRDSNPTVRTSRAVDARRATWIASRSARRHRRERRPRQALPGRHRWLRSGPRPSSLN